ncbi:MAG: histidine kinase [Bacteroidia bacterium]|nr:histidine kinase [Bacteroidia bacterium]
MTEFQQGRTRRFEIALHIVTWIFVFLALCLSIYQFMNFEDIILRTTLNILPWIGFFYANIYLVNTFLEKAKYWQFALGISASLILTTILRAEANASFTYEEFFFKDINWTLTSLFTNLYLLFISVLFQMLYNRYLNEKRVLITISEQREAQLQALRAQINPHFLFNTLNNIYALAMIDPNRTANMVLRLSKLLRYVIYESQNRMVNLSSEVSQIEEFIGLFQMRLEDTPNITFSYSGLSENQLIEPMVLIPFLENAFKHGDFDISPNAFLHLDLKVENGYLDFQALNSKNNQNQQKDAQGGVGLENIKRRLELKYEQNYQLEIQDLEEEFLVHLKLPITHG